MESLKAKKSQQWKEQGNSIGKVLSNINLLKSWQITIRNRIVQSDSVEHTRQCKNIVC